MNSELRCRAWDTVTKEMYSHESMCNPAGYGTALTYKEFVEFPSRGVVVMRYTGRKDRQGKDVVEGDIIECEYHGGLPTTENLDALTWRGTVVYGYDAAFHVQRINGGSYSVGYSGSAVKRWEVIGNIYQHPHLLEPQ